MSSKTLLVKKLGEIAADLASIRDLSGLERTITKTVDSIVKVEYSGLYFFDFKIKKFKMMCAKGFSDDEKIEAERTAMDRHPGWVFNTKKMLYIKDTLKDKSGNSNDSKRCFVVRSRLWLPVISYDEAVGAFGFASVLPNNFNEEHITTLSFVCNLAGVVYNNLQLQETRIKQTNDLIKANQNLIEINESLDTFAYKITHDLRSPATNVKGLVHILKHLIDKDSNSKINEVYTKLEKSIEILLEKLEGFVELLKLESSNENKIESCNLKQILLTITNHLDEELVTAKGLISINYKDFDIELMGIKEYLHSIFFNLIQNAIKYKSNDRKLVIDISLTQISDNVEIIIKDNGEGINMNYQDQLFTMFTRFSRNSQVGGSGVGLYIVKKQIEKSKGEISLEAELGKGSKFKIVLPKILIQ
ncbi:MAG: hypothetical protein COB15_11545 [Flavobacteriales bacterium]|nr:MAG: hypothetical protein COB15_11545 [Flavobacteriales bacterium]